MKTVEILCAREHTILGYVANYTCRKTSSSTKMLDQGKKKTVKEEKPGKLLSLKKKEVFVHLSATGDSTVQVHPLTG